MSANVEPHAVQPNRAPDNVEPLAVQRIGPACGTLAPRPRTTRHPTRLSTAPDALQRPGTRPAAHLDVVQRALRVLGPSPADPSTPPPARRRPAAPLDVVQRALRVLGPSAGDRSTPARGRRR